MTLPAWFNALLPPASHRGLLRRGAVVWTVALVIAGLNWLAQAPRDPFAEALVYSYAISTSIWLISDPLRIVARRWLVAEPPHFWRLSWRTAAWMLGGIVIGYIVGTSLGDAYAGHSTWALMDHSPMTFVRYLMGSLVISLAFLFFFYQREKALSLERQATEARLRLLETQLEPHMLFNTLANLRALIVIDQDKAVNMLDRLNDYLRATLRASRSDESAQQAHTLADEFARLDDYLALMAVRMGDRLRHRLTLPPALASHPLPPLLLQPLVENAIRHGLEPHMEGGEITVEARASGNELRLTVNDTGAGCAGEPGAHGSDSGFGLAQVRERLNTAFGPAPQGAERFQWRSAPGQGTRITLRLPLDAAAIQGNP